MDGGVGVSTPVNAFDTDRSVSTSHVLALKIMETANLRELKPDTIRDMSIVEFGMVLAGFRMSANDRALLGEALVGQRANNRGEPYRVTKLDFALASYGEDFKVPSMMRTPHGTVRFDAGPIQKAKMIEAGYRRTLQFVTSESWASWSSDGDRTPGTPRGGEQVTELGCSQVHAPECVAKSCFENKGNLGGECEWISMMKEDAKAQMGSMGFIKRVLRAATFFPERAAIGSALCLIVLGHLLDKSVGRLSSFMLQNVFGANQSQYCDHCLRHWDIDASPLEDRNGLTEDEQLRALTSRGFAPSLASEQSGEATEMLRGSPRSGVRRRRQTSNGRRTRSRTPSTSPGRGQGATATQQQQITHQLDLSIAFEVATNFTLRGVRQVIRWAWIGPTYALLVWLFLRSSMWPVSLVIFGMVLRQVGSPTVEQFLLIRSVDKSGRRFLFKYGGVLSVAVILGFLLLYNAADFFARVYLGIEA